MKLRLERKYLKKNYTIGHLFIDDKYFCDTLEHAVRKVEIPQKTAIDYGTYNIIIVNSPKFQIQVPLLQNVPRQHSIEIHKGNTIDDSKGCLLVGKNTMVGRLTESTITFNNLMMTIKNETDLSIEIV